MNESARKKTDQELFWAGDFGTSYTGRNVELARAREPFFRALLERSGSLASACELGANRGENLRVLSNLAPKCSLTGVEINPDAIKELSSIPRVTAVHSAIQDFNSSNTFDLTFTCGVLIHICPDDLPLVYRKLFDLSNRFILVNEYYNPSPVEIPYRGHSGKLFKRDFAGELWDLVGREKLTLRDKGFLWQRTDPTWDNTTWFLFEKR